MQRSAELVGKLVLGTVKFGLDYGISNNDGKTTEAEVKKFLDLAWNEWIRMLDTASAYGDSENVQNRIFII